MISSVFVFDRVAKIYNKLPNSVAMAFNGEKFEDQLDGRDVSKVTDKSLGHIY